MNTTVESISDTELDLMAWQIDRNGLAGQESRLRRVACRAGEQAAVSPVLLEVLRDPDAPEVARVRAFGLVAMQMMHTAPAAAPAAA